LEKGFAGDMPLHRSAPAAMFARRKFAVIGQECRNGGAAIVGFA
jgi:hypothetical protein